MYQQWSGMYFCTMTGSPVDPELRHENKPFFMGIFCNSALVRIGRFLTKSKFGLCFH
jgi:hypothetical protein